MRSNQSSLEGGESIRRGTCLCDVDQRMEASRRSTILAIPNLTQLGKQNKCASHILYFALKGYGINGSPFCPNEKLQEYTSSWRYHVHECHTVQNKYPCYPMKAYNQTI